MKPVQFNPDASAELSAAMALYENYLAGLGVELNAEAERVVREIQSNPARFARYRNSAARQAALLRFPYSVIYRELDDRIWIAAFAHHRRRPGY